MADRVVGAIEVGRAVDEVEALRARSRLRSARPHHPTILRAHPLRHLAVAREERPAARPGPASRASRASRWPVAGRQSAGRAWPETQRPEQPAQELVRLQELARRRLGQDAQRAEARPARDASTASGAPGARAPWASWRTWVRNSTSTSPPAPNFRWTRPGPSRPSSTSMRPPDVVDLRALGGREPRPEDPRPAERREPPGERRVAEDRAGAHERLALPERRFVREVAVERARGRGRAPWPSRPGGGGGPPGRPGPVARDRGEQRVEAVDDAVEVDVGLRPGLARPAVEHDEVQIGPVVELAPPELAHADDERRDGPSPGQRLAERGPRLGDAPAPTRSPGTPRPARRAPTRPGRAARRG